MKLDELQTRLTHISLRPSPMRILESFKALLRPLSKILLQIKPG